MRDTINWTNLLEVESILLKSIPGISQIFSHDIPPLSKNVNRNSVTFTIFQ